MKVPVCQHDEGLRKALRNFAGQGNPAKLDEMDRRSFLKFLGAIGIGNPIDQFVQNPGSLETPPIWFENEGITSSAAGGAVPRNTHPLAILQGPTDHRHTQLNVLCSEDQKFQFRLTDKTTGQIFSPDSVKEYRRAGSKWIPTNIFYSGLILDRVYSFEVLDESGAILDQRELAALNIADTQSSFAFLSCADYIKQHKMDEMWDSIASVRPALLFLIGDNVYCANSVAPADPDRIWEKYINSRLGSYKLFHLPRLIPTAAVWDDHDYGANDGNHTYIHKDISLEMFNAFYAQDNLPGVFQRGPGISSWYRAFGVQVRLMDSRYFKGLPGVVSPESHWGCEQEKWLLESIGSTQEPIILVNGTQYFKTFLFAESYEKQFKGNQRWLFEELRKIPNPVYFASGDVHFSELNEVPEKYLGYKTYEITASGFTKSRMFFVPIPPNGRRIHGVYKDNFVILQNRGQGPGLSWLQATCYGRKGKIYFKDNLVVRK